MSDPRTLSTVGTKTPGRPAALCPRGPRPARACVPDHESSVGASHHREPPGGRIASRPKARWPACMFSGGAASCVQRWYVALTAYGRRHSGGIRRPGWTAIVSALFLTRATRRIAVHVAPAHGSSAHLCGSGRTSTCHALLLHSYEENFIFYHVLIRVLGNDKRLSAELPSIEHCC